MMDTFYILQVYAGVHGMEMHEWTRDIEELHKVVAVGDFVRWEIHRVVVNANPPDIFHEIVSSGGREMTDEETMKFADDATNKGQHDPAEYHELWDGEDDE